MLDRIVEAYLLPRFPNLKQQLKVAKLNVDPKTFVKRALITALSIGFGISLIIGLLCYNYNIHPVFALLLFPFITTFIFFYVMLYPHAKIIHRKWEIDREVIFASRHILISLRSGMPLYDALLGTAEGYGEVSKEIEEIMRRTTAGVPLNHAIRDVAEQTPSENLKRILLQISNALTSGGDVGNALEAITEQISSEQLTSLKAYGQKLNPFIMFYMMFAIIFPSIGMAFAIILFSLVSGGMVNFSKYVLVAVGIFVALLQFLFVNAIESSRPKYTV